MMDREMGTGGLLARHLVLGGILVTYLALGTLYSVVTPVFEAPDESFHFFVVKHIVDHRALPVQRADTRGLWEQEASQPPLYYVLGALLVAWIDLSDAEDLLWSNPQANIGDPTNPGNKNVYVHSPEQDFPWRGTVLAVHVLRFFSLFLGAGTVVLVWRIVNLVFPRRSVLPSAVAAVAAFIPQFLFVTSAVNNDNAMTCLGTFSLYLLLRQLRDGVRRGEQAWMGAIKQWIGIGIVLGLVLLCKLSALALLGLTCLVIASVAWHRRSWRTVRQVAMAVGIPVVVIAGWWYVRNVILYGEPTGLTAMWQVVGRRSDFGQDLWGEFRALRYSFWGLFGWFSIPMPTWAYRVLDAFSLLALAGVAMEMGRWFRQGLWRGAWISWRYREPEWGAAYRPLCLLLMAIWLGAVSISLVGWTSLTPGTQGRLLFAAIAPCVLFVVLGIRAWFLPSAWVRDAASMLLPVAMLALALTVPWLSIAPAYARPAQIVELPEGAIPSVVRFGNTIVLRGVSFEQDDVRPGKTFKVNLYWEALRSLSDEDDLMVWLRMIDAAGQVVGLEDSYLGSGIFPTSLWPVGQLFATRQYVRVGEDTSAPLVVRLDVALYRATSGDLLPVPGEDLPTIGRVKIVPLRWPRLKAKEVIAVFDAGGLAGSVALAVCEWNDVTSPGETLSVTLTWQARMPPEQDYTVFVHLVDEGGRIYGYGDGAPREGNYPTRRWEAQEVIVDQHVVRVSADTPPGRYRIKAGLYDAGGRVPATDVEGVRWPGDAVDLDTVEVR